MKRNILKITIVFSIAIFFLMILLQNSVFANSFQKNREKKEKETKYEKFRNKIFDSFLKRCPDSIYYQEELKSKKWNYEQGLILEAFRQILLTTKDKKYFQYIRQNIDHYVRDDGTIDTYKYDDFNIDNIAPGRSLVFLNQITGIEKYKKAADLLRTQLQNQPRTNEGGFWHKKIYPYQMWLDGLYMGEPFYAMYSKNYNDPSAFDDIVNQFVFIYNHTKDKKTGLLYHAWDESKEQKWADRITGQSPHFWGRAIGWYMMAIVDVLDFFPIDHPKRDQLIKIFQTLSETLLKFKDVKTNLWYQVIDLPKRKGNYIEASASCMFTYAFAKGSNMGYLDPKFGSIAEKSFESIMKFLTVEDKDGKINLLHTCQGAGLGGDPYRDGSYEYYINEPQRTNDFKGYGPLMLAANELVKMEYRKTGMGKVVGLDYFYNNEWKDGKQYHYIWEDTSNSGFSDLGKIFQNFGAMLSQLKKFPTPEDLKKFNVYIIVDPDTPMETEKPNYIDDQAIKSIVSWVQNGGVLILLGNDSNNCEFKHFNRLAEKFGIKFNEDSKNRVTGKNFDMGAFKNLPDHPLFSGVRKIYMKEISTLSIVNPAKAILVYKSSNIIAESSLGKGYVFVVGDPWLYNEYIDNRKLPEGFDNYKAGENLIKWILGKAKKIKNDR
jgi:unsaturated rhamnogalacturonyl hydrolase